MIVGRASLRNPDNCVLSVSIEMTLAEWKRFQEQIDSLKTGTKYEVHQVRSLVSNLIIKAHKEFYINENDVVAS